MAGGDPQRFRGRRLPILGATMREWLLAGVLFVFCAGASSAECDPRGFFDTASIQSTEIQNLALAYNVTEGQLR